MQVLTPPDDCATQWRKILKFRPELHVINVVLKRIQDVSIRAGQEYCAWRWYHGDEDSAVGPVAVIGLKRASMMVARQSGADEREAKDVASLVSLLMPPCCNGTCRNRPRSTEHPFEDIE